MADTAATWFADRPRWQRRLALAACGTVVALGQAPTDLLWPALAALTLALWIIVRQVPAGRAAFGAGFWLGLGYFAVALRWIVSPFLVDVAAHGWMAPFALVFMAAGGALFWALATWAAARVAPGSLTLLVLTLTGVEALRSLVLSGFPWALIGHIWVGSGVAQTAAWVGPHGLTLLALAVCAGGAALLSRNGWGGVPVAVVAGLAVALAPGDAPSYDGPVVRLVQPNAAQDEKWDIDKRHVFFDRMVGYTAQDPRPDLVVWPETAIPALFDYAYQELEAAAEAAQGTPLITGINRHEGLTYYNAFLLVEQGALVTGIYDKSHIVPFGEYIPGGDWLAQFGITGLASSHGQGFTPGGVQPLVDIPGIGPARALICYEGIFAEEIATAARPRLMVLITNDAWFGKGAGPAQHLAQARLRAIEQGLPMARAANTGISAMIDAQGRVTGSLALNTAGYIDLPLPPAGPPTLYSRTGDWPVLVFLVVLLLGRVAARRGHS